MLDQISCQIIFLSPWGNPMSIVSAFHPSSENYCPYPIWRSFLTS
jgi:hypothetical protein